MKKTAIVAGSTGLVGSNLVRYLVESADYEVITAVVRKGSNIIYDGVLTIEIDYDQLTKCQEELKADVVFCCLGTTMKKAGSKDNFYKVDFTYPFELARIAERNGSSQFNIITAAGASTRSMFYYSRVKGEVEKAIRQLDMPNINIFRPSLLLGERNEKRAGEEVGALIAKIINPLMVGPMKRYRAIKAATVAEAMLQVSLQELKGVRIYESDAIQALGQGQ